MTFADASTNSPTSWLWTFGDGSAVNATARNPVHTYSAPGNYTVSLNATNAAGSNVLTRTRYITVTADGAAPVAVFTATPVTGTAPLTVTFADASTNSPTSWNWSFQNASAGSPVVYFGGKNLLTLNQADGAEDGTTGDFERNMGRETLSSSTESAWHGSRSVKIVTPGVSSSEGMYIFPRVSATPSTRYTGSVYVRGASGGEVVNLYIQERKSDNTHISYTFSGEISLTTNWQRISITSPGNAECGKVVIGVITPKVQAATIYVDGSQVEEGSSATAWGGDSSQNPVYTFTAPGSYKVALKATNAAGNDVMTRIAYINVTGAAVAPAANFTATPVSGTGPLNVTFTDTSANSPTSWYWSFGDGSSVNATARNPVHTYSAPGNYTVSLIATNAAGNGTIIKKDYISVTSVINHPPVLSPLADKDTDTGTLLTFAVSATDPDGNPLTYSATGLPADALFNPATRTFSWTPKATQAGSYNVTFTVTDGKLQDSESVGITVKDGSLAPVLGPIANASVNQRETITVQITGSDPDGDTLTFSASGLPAGARFDPATRQFTWTPAYNQAGNYNVRFSVTDGALTSSRVVTFTAVYVNYAPEFTGGIAVAPLTIDEGSAAMVNVSASDWNHDALTYSAANLPAGATFDTASRTLSWTPDYSQAGVYSITLTASDGKLQDSAVVTINVNNVAKPKNVPDPAEPPKKKIHIMLS